MHSRSLFIMGFLVASSLAQDLTATTSSSTTIATGGSACYGCTDAIPAMSIASVPDSTLTDSTSSTITAIPHTFSNTTVALSNISTTMITVSSSLTSYINSSFANSSTSMEVPTSILVATGTPSIPSPGSTVTSYLIVAPSSTGAATPTSTPTTQGSGARKAMSGSRVAFVVLGISALLLV